MAEELLDTAPVGLYERLREIEGYRWDESKPAYHSSYNNWQVFGTRDLSLAQNQTGTGSAQVINHNGLEEKKTQEVIARVSNLVLREERAYHICMKLLENVDPDANHIIRPIKLQQLPSLPGDVGPLVVSIFEHPGPNYLSKVIDHGPAFYRGRQVGDKHEAFRDESPLELMQLHIFMDFAIGATECLEILHHSQRITHGEIRGDAFHMNSDTGKVKIMNLGSGIRTFEHGLTSNRWSMLSKEVGAKTKLCFMAPEQTGRMPTEPDSRTDIYSLGILFWTILTQQPAFHGETPMDIIQGVLGRRLPPVSKIRLDIPDVIGRIIQKMTSKIIGDRYHSVTGLKYDLIEVRRLLGIGDSVALETWNIATRDVSSFFTLPIIMIGRTQEHEVIVKVIDIVSKLCLPGHVYDSYIPPTGISLNEGGYECSEISPGMLDHLSSDGDAASSIDGRSSPFISNIISGEARYGKCSSAQLRQAPNSFQHSSFDSIDSSGRSKPTVKFWEKSNALSLDCSKNAADSLNSDQQSKISSDGVGSLGNHRSSQKRRHKGRCEFITIAGAAGLGKTCLVQSVQIEARKRGYFASSKFDQAKRTAFGPVLKLLSSLFKQVFSESDTETPFHQMLKKHVQPAWPILHKLLGLPIFLLGPVDYSALNQANHQGTVNQQSYNKSLRVDLRKRESSPTGSKGSLHSMAFAAQNGQEFLHSGSSTKSLRILNTCLDILRLFIQHKFICFCLDDLQFADDESLEFIMQILASRMRMVIIITYRPDESLSEKAKAIIESSVTKEHISNGGLSITKINLTPLSEEDVRKYVAATLRCSDSDVISLAALINTKTGGNPFNMREMLNSCYRKQCIYYDYKQNRWCYDIDKIFKEYNSSLYQDRLNSEFAMSRLNELPPVSRVLLTWASFVGSSFSFDLVRRLLSSEFDYDEISSNSKKLRPASYSQQDAVEGLQSAIQASIIVATQDDERFCFTHDRYMQAATSLGLYSASKMHFIIAQTLLKYYYSEESDHETIAIHIGKSIDIIKTRVIHKHVYRKVLFDCAQSAAESGAFNTAVRFYNFCFDLLQENHWEDGGLDVYYTETLQLHTRAAECHLYTGNHLEARKILGIVISRARTEVEKAPAWVLKSRIYAQEGDSHSAFRALKSCLVGLGIDVDDEASFEKCDADFERLIVRIQSMDTESLINRPVSNDSDLFAVGAVLVETISAACWTDQLRFYQMALVMVNTHLTCGSFPQVGMAYINLSIIAITRFNMIKFACQMADISYTLVCKWQDPYTMGRRGISYSLFVGHIQSDLQDSLDQLDEALHHSIQAGDRISTILNFALVGHMKLFLSVNLADLEAFMCDGCEEVPNWSHDTRGGTIAIAVRQTCRALQGKTSIMEPLDILSDEDHDSQQYKLWLIEILENSDRQFFFYEGMELTPLFLYGHYDRAIEVGASCLKLIDCLWSARHTRYIMLMYGLALASLIWTKVSDPLRTVAGGIDSRCSITERLKNDKNLSSELWDTIRQIKSLRKKIEYWQAVTDVNYFSWSKLLAAQIAEMEGEHGIAMKEYEESIDHASAHEFIFEEALGNYLLAGFFLRSNSRRAAKGSMREAIYLFRALGASGVAKYIGDEHSLLLQGPTKNDRTLDVAVQTNSANVVSEHVQYNSLKNNDDHTVSHVPAPVQEHNLGQKSLWHGGSARDFAESGLLALDMLDLTSILESSQVISSVLQIDQLLKTMCKIILQNCGGLATTAAIVVDEDPHEWSIAASGDLEKGVEAHIPGIPLAETAIVAEGVILYCARFRETVFVPDLIRDERFSNVTEAWAARNLHGKSVIAIPICHGTKPLLGVLYLEGEPNAFTNRNLTLLQLLVNQIGISYSNALTWKEVEKVSASNKAMVGLQKAALIKALKAEEKANMAKAEALHSVKVAEEAMKAKSIFLANVSHELRTPLNGVIGNSELLRESCLTKDQAEMAELIRISADLLLTLINDILDFSKMEAGKMELDIVAFKADEMMREIFRSVSYSSKGKKENVDILDDIQIPGQLIFGDPVRLHQVLGNLVSNSMKFTETGSIIVAARTDLETKDNLRLKFWVKDTGIGISSQKLVKLFKPFSQADASTARKYGGSGLGLSICKSLVESMMGGKIELESIEGQGTTCYFTINFPKANGKASPGDSLNSEGKIIRTKDQHTEGSSTPYNIISHIPREEIRICIAEDNPVNKKIAVQFIHKLGFRTVDAYENGLEAVKGLRLKAKEGKPYHIVLMDVQMPVLDGYEATKLLRQDSNGEIRGILVIAMTASAIQGDREKCLESGMNDYLAKPVKLIVLKNKLEFYLQESQRSKALSLESLGP